MQFMVLRSVYRFDYSLTLSLYYLSLYSLNLSLYLYSVYSLFSVYSAFLHFLVENDSLV